MDTCEVIPSFSTNITAAWKVVETIDYKQFELVHLSGGNWRCSFWYPEIGEISACATTAPLAICRAALLIRQEGEDQ